MTRKSRFGVYPGFKFDDYEATYLNYVIEHVLS